MNTKINNGEGENLVSLKHNDLIILNGRKGYVGTVRGMAVQYTGISAKYNTNPEEDVKRELSRGHEIYWIGQAATCLCGDKGFYEAEQLKWSHAIKLEDGQQVLIEGDIKIVHYKGDYSDMAYFINPSNCTYESNIHGCNNPKIGDCMCYNPTNCKGYKSSK